MRKYPTGLTVKQTGFTLIELVIVIVIIGILAAVALPNFGNVSDSAKRAKNEGILGSVKSAYAVALALNKGAAVTVAQVVAQQADPVCIAYVAANADPAAATATTHTCGTAAIDIPTGPTSLTIACQNC